MRSAIAALVNRPCLRALRLPLGGPEPGAPPCMRQRFLPRTAGANFCAAAGARQHRGYQADVIAHAGAVSLVSTGAGSGSERSDIRLLRAALPAAAALLSETITRACWVTLPTMALP